jgi:DNA repair exonuclease SbcCD ATPase subunit
VNPNVFDAELDAVAAAAAFTHAPDWAKTFRFDYCFGPESKTSNDSIVSASSDQKIVHQAVGSRIVDAILSGTSASCFTYGRTGTGKSYTLFGKADETSNMDGLSESSGLIPRVLTDIFAGFGKDTSLSDTRITLSFLEIYNEKIRDLLVTASADKAWASDSSDAALGSALKVREHPYLGPYVEGLLKAEVQSAENAIALLCNGSHQRTVGSSLFKPLSSRSHAIVILELSPKEIDINAIATGKVAYPFSSKSNKVDDILVRLHVVDLAGSEREDTENSSDVYSSKPLSGPSVSSSKSSSYTMSPLNSSKRPQTAEEKLELKLIRRSLSTLGYIIRALHKNAPYPTLPYRDSVLTWLLRDALCGKRHVTMLATLSPSHTSYEETLNTLKYAGRLCRHTPVELLPRKIVQSEDKGFIEEFNSVSSWQRVMRNSTDSISRTTTPISTPARSRIVSELTQGSSQKMLHQTLGGGTPGSSAAQKLLQNVVSDPQQRLAKLGMNDVYHRSMIDSYASSENSTLSEQPGSTAASASAMMFQVVDLLDDGTQQSNVDSHNHRELQGQLVELQIELQSARTDRDSMLLELQAARDALNAATSTKVTSTDAMSDLTGRLRYAEDSVEELKSAGSQKDAEIDRLASELESEKNAKRELESSMKAQEDGYVARAEALEREHAALLDEYDKVQLASRITQENAEEATKSLNSLSTPIRKDSLEVSMQCLREENSDLREQNENLIRRNADHEQAMGAVEKKVQELVESQRECEERLAASQKTINAFPKERERYKGLIESMRAANAKLAEKVKAAKESAKECAKEPENDAEDTCTASKVGSQAGTSEGVNATLAALTRENNELKAQLLQKREELLERMKRASDDYLNEMYAASVDDDIDAEDVCGLEEGLKALIAREDILNNTDVRSKKEKDRSKQLTENIQTQLSSIRKTCTDNFNLRQDLDKDKFKIQELEKKIIALQGGTVDERVAAAEQSLADVKDRMVTKENMIEDLKMQIKMMENLPQYDRKTAQEQGLSPRSRLDNASLQQAYENKIKALLKQQDELKDELLAKPSSNMNLMAITDGSNRSNGDGRAQVIVSLGTVGGNPAPSRTPTRTHTQSVSSESGANLPANSATPSPAELQNLLVEQKKATEMSEARAVYWERVAQKVRNLTGEDSTDEVVAALRKENEDLKAMTFDLKSQLEQARQEVDKMKEELKAQGDVKAEFASLWMTVQELNAVDAQKEAALSALVEDRDRLTKEKNEVEVKMAGLADAYTHLQSELMAIDSDLAQAAEDEKISVSAEKPKSLNKQVNGKERIKPANSNGMKHASTGPQMTSHPRGKGSNVAPVAPSLSPLDTRTFSNLLGIPHEKAIAATAHQNARSKSPRPWDNAFSYTMSPRNSTTPPRAPLSAQPRSNGRSVGSAKKELSRGKKSSDVHRNSITSLSSMKTSSSAGSKKTKNLQHMLAPLPVGDDDSIVAEAVSMHA